MKNLLIILFALILVNFSFGQTQTKSEELSNSEIFSSKAGTLIHKEFIDIGNIRKAEIQVIKLKDLISLESITAVRFEAPGTGTYSSTKIAQLDSDEIEGMIKSLEIIQNNIMSNIPTNYTEVTYKSRGGFEAGCFLSKGNWSPYLKLKKYDSDSYVFLKQEDITELLSLLNKAKSML